MRRVGFGLITVGILTSFVVAAEPPGSPNRGGVTVSTVGYAGPITRSAPTTVDGRIGAQVSHAGCGAMSDCGAACEETSRRQRLKDFLCYRPLRGCDCFPKLADYTPPLHSWFPPCCHANGGHGCSTCGDKAHCRGGCSTCGHAHSAAVPVFAPPAPAPVVAKKATPLAPAPVMAKKAAPPVNNKPVMSKQVMVAAQAQQMPVRIPPMPKPQKPAAPPPASEYRPASFAPPTNFRSDYRIEPEPLLTPAPRP